MRVHYDPMSDRYVLSNGTTPQERERALTMAGHDALPAEWRILSSMIQGRAAERHFKRNTPLAKARKALLGIHRARQE